MSGSGTSPRLTRAEHEALRADVSEGLGARPKRLPPRWFYDATGSELFEQITRLAEYYPTGAEREILRRRAGDIASATRAGTLVELGSGSSDKTRLLLGALREIGTLRDYVPVDVSESALAAATQALRAEFPGLTVRPVRADFQGPMGLPRTVGPRLLAFLGGTIGNLLPAERARFLTGVRGQLDPGDHLLLGTDLVKDPGTLVAAYDDPGGVTARFNRNVLSVINRELGADFDPDSFAHLAVWDAAHEWIEMRLVARRPLTVKISAVDLVVDFDLGEEIRTEVSAKFRPAGVERELRAAGFERRAWWTDSVERYGVSLSVAASAHDERPGR